MQNIVLLADRDSVNYKGITYSYLNAFKTLGYNVQVVTFNTNERLYRYTKFFNGINRSYLSYLQGSVIQNIEKSKADFVFVIKGFYLLPETIKRLRNADIRIGCFNPDDPFSPIAGSSNQNVQDCISLYDTYFIWSKKLIDQLKVAGTEHVVYLPFAADIELMKIPQQNTNKKEIDVSFIGNGDKERKMFLNSLGSHVDLNNYTSTIFGKDWGKVMGFSVKEQVYNKDFLDALHNSKINLNILRTQNKGSHNMRTFDIPACGGFLLHEYSEEVADFFKVGEEFDSFQSVDECADKIKYYLKNELVREKMAIAGYNKVVSARYNYVNNVKVIDEHLFNLVNN